MKITVIQNSIWEKMIANELSPAKAIEALEIIKTAQVIKEKKMKQKLWKALQEI